MALPQDFANLGDHSQPSEKPCRACTDFRSWMKSQRTSGGAAARPGKTDSDAASATTGSLGSPGEKEGSGAEEGNSPAASSSRGQTETDEDPPLWGKAAKYGCPADSVELGKGSWRLLHSMAAYYPPKPSGQQQQDMKSFISIFSKFYPCQPCAEDFREWLKSNPPAVDSQKSLSRWFCEAHNEVNSKLGKPLFNCDFVNERWKDGWKDGSCD